MRALHTLTRSWLPPISKQDVRRMQPERPKRFVDSLLFSTVQIMVLCFAPASTARGLRPVCKKLDCRARELTGLSAVYAKWRLPRWQYFRDPGQNQRGFSRNRTL